MVFTLVINSISALLGSVNHDSMCLSLEMYGFGLDYRLSDFTFPFRIIVTFFAVIISKLGALSNRQSSYILSASSIEDLSEGSVI